jgi:hypothetical protein
MTTTERVVVTGLGAVTPIGLSVDAFWKGLITGTSGAAAIRHFDASEFKTHFACELKGFDPQDYMDRKLARRIDPFCQFAIAAAREALDDAGLCPNQLSLSARERIGVVFGSGIGGLGVLETQAKVLAQKGPRALSPFTVPMMIGNMAAGLISIEFGLKGPNHGVVSPVRQVMIACEMGCSCCVTAMPMWFSAAAAKPPLPLSASAALMPCGPYRLAMRSQARPVVPLIGTAMGLSLAKDLGP